MDISRFMDAVCEEVTNLLLDGVRRSASLCASLCAERIVSARREMQRRWAEERRELERLYELQGGTVVRMEQGYGASLAGGLLMRSASTPTSAPRHVGPVAAPPESSPPRGTQPYSHGQSGPFFAPPVPKSSAMQGGSPVTVVGRPSPGASAGASPASPRRGGERPPAGARVSDHRQGSPSRSPGSEMYDTVFMDAHGAVQDLEEQTHQAAHAMDLLDEALNDARRLASTGGVGSPTSMAGAGAAAHGLQAASAGGFTLPLAQRRGSVGQAAGAPQRVVARPHGGEVAGAAGGNSGGHSGRGTHAAPRSASRPGAA